MSMITENTIVVRSDSVEKLFLAFDKQSKTYGWISGKQEVFNNGKISIWNFDCNGQPLGVEENADFLILETNYLDGEPYYTQVFDTALGYCLDSKKTAEELIKNMVTEEEFKKIQPCIAYAQLDE